MNNSQSLDNRANTFNIKPPGIRLEKVPFLISAFKLVINKMFHLRLRIAFKWMVRAFSGYLSTDQLLLLWDRILGYESLEIVAGGSFLSLTIRNCLLNPLY